MEPAFIISIIALAVSVVGWGITYYLGLRSQKISRIGEYQLKMYLGLFNRTNELIKNISGYTADCVHHTRLMAKLLNEYNSDELASRTKDNINRKYDLKISWIDAAYSLSNNSYIIQKEIEDYLRYLDMNGMDYASSTKVYEALQNLKEEAYASVSRNIKRWSDPSEMDSISVSEYKKKSNDTEHDSNVIFDFGMCLDDVLGLVYNDSIAKYLNKPKKKFIMQDKRRYITRDGIVDKREDSRIAMNDKDESGS